MLKWCKNVARKNQWEVSPAVYQCEQSPLEWPNSCQKVDAVAISSLSQQKVEKPYIDQEICHLDHSQCISAMQEIQQENRQYQAWIKNIKSVLQNMQNSELKKMGELENAWESSVKCVLKKISRENTDLQKERKRKNKEIRYLEDLVEEIAEENREIIDAIDAFHAPVEVFGEAIKRDSFSSSTETIVSEETSMECVCKTSKESGYSSEESICSSTETLISEEPDTVFMQVNKQITELEKKNTLYKKWVSSLDKKISSNLTLHFIKYPKMPHLKILEDLKAPSFRNVELKQKNEEVEKIIQSLKIKLEKVEQENSKIHVLYHYTLSEEIYLHTLNGLEKGLSTQQKEIEDIDNHFEKLQKKADKLYKTIEKFTICLEEIRI